jgi:uncharacterized damage-inducible protein DinB
MMNNKLIKNIVKQLQDIQNQENWLDENFENKIEQISDERAFQRPLPELHSVAELISHLWVWRMESIKKLTGMESHLTVESPQNWRTNEELKKIGWQKLKADFYQSQQELIQLIENKSDEYLESEYVNGAKFQYLVEGLIHHDLYHLGQIGITIKFLNLKKFN